MNDQLISMKLHINFIKNIQHRDEISHTLCDAFVPLQTSLTVYPCFCGQLVPPPHQLICNPFIILEVLLFLAKNINKKDKSKYI